MRGYGLIREFRIISDDETQNDSELTIYSNKICVNAKRRSKEISRRNHLRKIGRILCATRRIFDVDGGREC